jgi:6-bladed beta-propeller
MRYALLASLGVIAVLGCSGGETGPAWAGSVRDSAGVTLVVNPDEGLWKPSEAWRLQEDLRIGEFGADPEYMFGQVGSIALNSRGELLVMDRQLRQVRVFSPEGAFIRAFGSAGPGPEEFGRGVTDVFVGPGDAVLVPDVRHRAIHRYDPDGVHLRPSRWT